MGILEKIFPGAHLMELKGLSRKELLERILEDSPVHTSCPEPSVAEEKATRIYPSISNFKPQSSPNEIQDAPYSEPIPGERIMDTTDALSLPNQRSPLLGPSNSKWSLSSSPPNLHTTSAFSYVTDPSFTIWDSQTNHQMMNPYNGYSTTRTDDLLCSSFKPHIQQIPHAADTELHSRNPLYQLPLWKRHCHPSSENPISYAGPWLGALHSSTTGYTNQNWWCSPTPPLDVGPGPGQNSGTHSTPMTGPRNEVAYWPDTEDQTGSSNTSC